VFDPGPHIGDLAMRKLPVVPDHLSMAAARKIAALKQAALLLVERDACLVGLLDERALGRASDAATVAEAMASIAARLHPAMPLSRARELFTRASVAVLPVVVGNLLVGAITRRDLDRALCAQRAIEGGPSSAAA
jgi:Mg/Co/Ni transporter MgtE